MIGRKNRETVSNHPLRHTEKVERTARDILLYSLAAALVCTIIIMLL